MEQIINGNFLIVFSAAILGFLVAAILVFVKKTDTFPSRLLAGFLVCISLLALNFALMTTRFFINYPHLWRVVGWASFSFAPLAYLYVRSSLEQSYRFKPTDILLFIPAIMHPFSLVPFFIKPAAEKLIFLQEVFKNPRLVMLEPENFFPPGAVTWARFAVGFLCTAGQVRLLLQWKKRNSIEFENVQQNTDMFRWLSLFTLVLSVFWGLILLQFIFHFTGISQLNMLVIFTISSTIVFVSTYLLVKPSILYGIRGWGGMTPAEKPAVVPESPEESKQEARRYNISAEQGRVFKEALERHFSQQKPFLKGGYSISDLSNEINVRSYQLSTFINQEYGQNFNELVNQYRVRHMVEQ
ncbi:MAG: hypothetical protein MUE58_13145, partial [Chitinophagaceae bacterium]|nr:hypothetical protein [Chitinophagaceae bacterium]